MTTVKQGAWAYEGAGSIAALLQARREFKRALAGLYGVRLDLEASELIFSELMANAMLHGRPNGTIDACLTVESDRVFLTVTNEGPAFHADPHLPAPTATRGRGLYLVAQLGHDLSVSGNATRCSVDVRLPLAER